MSKKVGAPSKYKKIYAEQVIDYVMNNWRDGASFRRWGLERNILPTAMHQWATDNKEFSNARTLCREYEKEYWIELLRKAASGLSDDITETTTELDLTKLGTNGKPRPVKQFVTKKKARMSVAAIVFALKNLFPDEWKEIVTNVVDPAILAANKIQIEFVEPKK